MHLLLKKMVIFQPAMFRFRGKYQVCLSFSLFRTFHRIRFQAFGNGSFGHFLFGLAEDGFDENRGPIWKIWPSREWSHIPPEEKENHLQNGIFWVDMLVSWRVVKLDHETPGSRGENEKNIWVATTYKIMGAKKDSPVERGPWKWGAYENNDTFGLPRSTKDASQSLKWRFRSTFPD